MKLYNFLIKNLTQNRTRVTETTIPCLCCATNFYNE